MRKQIKRLTKKDIAEIKSFINLYEKFKNAYFWNSPGSASQRRKMENDNYVEETFNFNGMIYEFWLKIRCSCKNIYVDRGVRINGETKTIKALKKLVA